MKSTTPSVRRTLALFVCLACASPVALTAQGDSGSAHPSSTEPMKVFYLKYAGQPNDGNEILTGIRLMVDPPTKIYLVRNRDALIVRGKPDQLALAAQIIDALDKPGRIFRLTYTINESAGKRIGSQHFALIIHAGQRVTLKQGEQDPDCDRPVWRTQHPGKSLRSANPVHLPGYRL